jgi:hypothetical protein
MVSNAWSLKARRGAGLAACAAALSFSACSAPPPQVVTHTLHRPLTGPCPTDDGVLGRGEFGAEVQEFAATVAGPGITEPLTATASGAVTLEEVPPGEDRVFALFGLASGQARWRGISTPFTVAAGEELAIDVVMAAVADVTCARSIGGPRAFHTATTLDDGTVLVVGGAGAMADASGVCNAACLRATGTDTAAIYDPKTGLLTPLSSRLNSGRLFHTAAKLSDGRVVIAGGTAEALFRTIDGALFPFPVQPTQPLATIEIYDPATGTFQQNGADPGGPRVFAAAVTTLTGQVLITGGIPAAGNPHDLGNALSTTTLCSGDPLQCVLGPPMARPRAGHMAFTIAPEGTFFWGGSVDLSDDGHRMEFLAEGASTSRLVEVAGMQVTRNLFFAAGTRYLDFRFLAAGGMYRLNNGTFSTSDENGNNLSARAFVYDISAQDSAEFGGITRPMNMQSGRIMASAAGLPDGASAIVAGGFQVPTNAASINWTPSSDLELFDEATLQMLAISVNNEPRTLREPRAGLTATAIGDGTVVFIGGYVANGTAATAEVFADIKTPPQAAGLQ